MNFPEAVRGALSRYATFAGRARRSEFWFFYLFLMLMQLGAGILDAALFGLDGVAPIGGIVTLGLFLPMLAVSVRRLHDDGRSGWWLLIGLVPLIGWIVLIFWYVQRGQDGPNRFGPDPRAGDGFDGGYRPPPPGAGTHNPAPPGGAGRPWPVNGPGSRPGGA